MRAFVPFPALNNLTFLQRAELIAMEQLLQPRC
jgi:hypothetical protein